MKKISLLLIILSLFVLSGCKIKTSNKKTIIATNFPAYDFARAVLGDTDTIELKMLLTPGAEIHDFEPSPKDVKNIIDSSIFIYVGGESDEWIDDILSDINKNKTSLVKLMDLVDLKKEEIVDGMESDEKESDEYDEHIWTSLDNAIIMIDYIKEEIIKIDPDNKAIYEENATNYINQIKDIDNSFKDIVKNGKRNEIIFGDRFPLRYFVDEYNLKYYAAFPGCSEQTEASAKTISFLINKVKDDNIPVVFKIELSNGNIAKTISNETNAKVLEFNTAHNISLDDFNKGITYVDIMKNNLDVLEEALN